MSRHALRAGVVCAVASLSLLAASPAFALVRDDGDEPGEPMSKMDAMLIFGVIPVASLIVIWVACMAGKKPAPKPGHTILGPPIWYNPPDEHGRIVGHQPPSLSGGDGHGGSSARY